MPYPFGIDTAFSNLITAAMAQQLDFSIPRIGTLGYGYVGTSSYYNKTLNPDSAFAANVANCQNAQKPVGCYFFSYAWNVQSAEHEATQVCDVLDALNISLEMPVFFDWEYDSDDKTTAAGVPVSNTTLQTITIAFMDKVNQRGRTAGWYANMDYVNNKYGSAWTTQQMVNNYYFWVAAWGGGADPPRSCDVWQYAGDVIWSGIDADLNYLINERCVNGQIGKHFRVWMLHQVMKKRKRKVKPFQRW